MPHIMSGTHTAKLLTSHVTVQVFSRSTGAQAISTFWTWFGATVKMTKSSIIKKTILYECTNVVQQIGTHSTK